MTNPVIEQEIERQFFESLYTHGINYKSFTPIMDGKLHRFATAEDKGKETSGAYVIHTDGTANWSIKDFRQHAEMIKCLLDPSYLSDSDRREYEEQIKQHHTPEAKKEREQKRKEEAQHKEQSESAARAQALRTYEEAKNSGECIYENAYLQKKGINSEYYLEEDYSKVATNKAGNLLIPLVNISTGKFQSLQTIDPNGNKRFWPGLSRQGTAYIFSNDKPKEALNCKTIYICEGYATGASIQHTPGLRCFPVTVICAMSCHDITDIAKTVRKINPKAEITIAADHDTAGLPPAIKCLEQGIADYVSIPPERGEDWNDYEQKHPDLGDKDANAIMHRKQSKEQLPELKAELKALEENKQAKQKAQAQEPNPVIEPVQPPKKATYEPEAPNIYEDLIDEPKEPDSATNITPPWPDYSDWPEPKEPPEAYVAHEAQPQATKEATPPAQLNTVQAVSKEQEKPTPRQKSMEESNGIKIINAYELLNMSFPEPKYAVEGIIPEGLTVLAGGPKIGKSALVLHLFVAISLGGYALGRIEVTEGNVLYLALEDTPRRLKTRLARIIKDTQCTEEDAKKLAKSSLVTQCPRQNEGGIDFIRQHLGANPDTRLVIIDTLQKFRRTQTGKGNNQYAEDYDTVAEIKALADEFHVAILLVHHVKKGAEVDWLNTISGTQGIAGAADTILILERSRNSNLGKLSITGRDVEEKSYDMEVNKFSWILKGESQPEKSQLSGISQKIVDYLELNAGDSYSPADIAKKLDIKENTAAQTLNRLAQKELIKKNLYGSYYIPKKEEQNDS